MDNIQNRLQIISSKALKLRKLNGPEDDEIKLRDTGISFSHEPGELLRLLIDLERWEKLRNIRRDNITELCTFLRRDSIDCKDFLARFEPFLRSIHGLVYEGRIKSYKGVDYYQSTGAAVNDSTNGIILYSRHFLRLDVIPGWEFNEEVDGKKGITDLSITAIRDFSETFRISRNSQLHGLPESGTDLIDKEAKKPTDTEWIFSDIAASVSNTLIVLIAHILDYRYDTLRARIKPVLDQYIAEESPAENEEDRALAYIKDKYIPYVEKYYGEKLRNETLINLTFKPDNNILFPSDSSADCDDDSTRNTEHSGAVIEEILAENDRMLLCGPSGAGKSTTMSRVMIMLAKEWNGDDSDKLLPVRYDFKLFEPGTNILDRCLPEDKDSVYFEQEKRVVGKYFEKMVKEGRVLFILDGLNETSPNIQADVLDYLKVFFNNSFPKARFIITSRFDEAVGLFPKLAEIFGTDGENIKSFRINPLSDKQIEDYARRRMRNIDDIHRLHETPELGELAGNPLQLRIITDILNADSTIDTDCLNRSTLYERFIVTFLTREFKQQSKSQADIDHDILRFEYNLARLAKSFLNNETVLVGGVRKIYSGDVALTGEQICHAEKLGLISTDGENYIAFTHDSFFNFFTAKHLILEMRCDKNCVGRLVRTFIVDTQQVELLRMLIELLVSHDGEHGSKILLPAVLTSYLSAKRSQLDWSGINSGLSVLASIIRTIPRQPEKWTKRADGAESTNLAPHAIFDGFVLNIMNEIRLSAVGSEEIDRQQVWFVFDLIARSSSPRLIDNLFSPFWLQLWALAEPDIENLGNEFAMPRCDYKKIKQSSFQLFNNIAAPTYLVMRTIELWTLFQIMRLKKSCESITLYSNFWWRYPDSTLKEIVRHLRDNLDRIPFAGNYALKALISMSGPEWVSMYESCRQGHEQLGLSKPIIGKQISNIVKRIPESDRIFNIINSLLPAGDSKGRNLRRFFFVTLAKARMYKDEIVNYIATYPESMDYLANALDRFPLSDFTPEQADSVGWDRDVRRFTLDAVENTADRIPYIVSGCGPQNIHIIVPDIKEDFITRKMLLPDVDVTGVAEKHYNSYSVIKDRRITLRRLSVEISRADGSVLPLPVTGTLHAVTEEGTKTPDFIYLAEKSTGKGLELTVWNNSVWNNSVIDLLTRAAAGSVRPVVGDVPCNIRITQDISALKYYRVLTLDRNGRMPMYSSLSMLADEQDMPVVKIDNSITVPLNYRDRYFMPVLLNSAQNSNRARYAVYGYMAGCVIMLTEADNIEPGRELQIEDVGKPLTVLRTENSPKSFIELQLTSPSPGATLSRYGRLTLDRNSAYWDGEERIPYIAAFKYGNRFVIRVADEEWVERLATDTEFVRSLLKERVYKAGGLLFRVVTIEKIDHIKGSKLITVHAPGSERVPLSGFIEPRLRKGDRFRFRFIRRVRMPFIENIAFVYCGSTSGDIPILEAGRGVNAECMPESLYIRIKENPRLGLLRRIKPEQEGGAVRFSLDSPVYAGNEGSVLDGVEFLAYWPVNNTPQENIFEFKNSYNVSDVHYCLLTERCRQLRMPAPLTDIDGMYCRIGNNPPMLLKKENTKTVIDPIMPYYKFLHLMVPDGFTVESEGNIRFFYDDTCEHPAALSYDRILSQMELNMPRRYHADTCDIVFREACAAGYFSQAVFDLLAEHNLAENVRKEFLADEPMIRQLKYPETLRFDVCHLVARNDSALTVYSAIKKKKINIDNTNPSVPVGSLIHVEKDGTIYPVETNPANRCRQMGFMTGIVVRIDMDKRDVHIRTVADGDYFYHYAETEVMEHGDIVSFFPTYNLRTGQKMATKVFTVEKGLRMGVVAGLDVEHENDVTKIIVSITDNANPEYTAQSYIYSNEYLYSKAETLRLGDEIEFLYQDGGYPRPDVPKGMRAFIIL